MRKMDYFKIGDEIMFRERPSTCFVVTCVDPVTGLLSGIGPDGIAFVDKDPEKWEKTGRYFEEAAVLMDKLNKNGY